MLCCARSSLERGWRAPRRAETLSASRQVSESRSVEVGHQSEPSVAWCTGNRHCETYTGSAQAA